VPPHHLLRAVLLLVASFAGIGRVGADGESAPDHPRVHFEYSDVWTEVCADLTEEQFAPEVRERARVLASDLAREWDRQASDLLGTAVAAVGARFRARELHAVVSLCRLPSLSRPLLVNVRPWVGLGPRRDRAVLIGTVFHEVLHWYVHPLIPPRSPLLARYAAEPLLVRRHLHLLALMRHVYLKLGRGRELALIVEAGAALPQPAYRRAWDIVIAVGEGPFVSELRPPS
jgi:hypothetical protein